MNNISENLEKFGFDKRLVETVEIMKRPLIILSLLLIVLAVTFGPRLYKELTVSLVVDVPQGPTTTVSKPPSPLTTITAEEIGRTIEAAGINPEPLLGETGISGHLQRLKENKTDIQELQQYAQDLHLIKEYTFARKGLIPSSFWDVRTPEMEKNNWTEYSLVHQLTLPEWKPYLQLLTQAYTRFLRFKRAEAAGNDTALDSALDIFAMVEDFFHVVQFASLTVHAKEITGETGAVLMIWQSVIAGSSRTNPLTGKPLFSHSIFARNNVGTMFQHAQGETMSTGKVWGVSGFAPRFVGIPHNDNQIEHMSISMVIHVILHEPLIILDAIEEEKLLAGTSRKEESYADMALNNAIHKEFFPYFSKNRLGAVENLRYTLKKPL